VLRRKKRLFDAHEYFTEVPEVTSRPLVQFFWSMIARICLPFYRYAYTVGPALAGIFEKKYGLKFKVLRNVPALAGPKPQAQSRNVLLYQGALNAGRGIEAILQAMQQLDGLELWLAGEGDLSQKLRTMALELGVQEKVRFLGFVKPEALKALTQQAWLGLNVLENKGLSYYYSLANKFFDYVQAGVPVLTMDFPEYRALNAQHEVAVLLDRLRPEALVSAIRHLQQDPEAYRRLQQATQAARLEWNWEKEEQVLLTCWDELFGTG
jgi:glycosyltransferase involved in cell wall biosynthesis